MMDEPDDPGPSLRVDDHQTVPVDVPALAAAARAAMRAMAMPAGAALDVTLVDPERMADLKRDALGVHRPTDVLSFPIDDPASPSPGPLLLGDIVLCPAVAAAQGAALGYDVDDELLRLLVHGLVHLSGADHGDVAGELAMAGREREILAAMGVG